LAETGRSLVSERPYAELFEVVEAEVVEAEGIEASTELTENRLDGSVFKRYNEAKSSLDVEQGRNP
jgi:hypothetical protein